MKASTSGILTYIISIILAYGAVRIGYSRIYTQISDPYLGGTLWPISVAGVLLVIFVSVVVTLAILFEGIERIQFPLLYGRSTYTLVGSAGLLGTSIGAARILYNWSNTGIDPSLGSVGAAMLVVVPAGYASYRLWQSKEFDQDSLTADSNGFEPEFVRDKTAQWDSEPTQQQSTLKTGEGQHQLQSNHSERKSQQTHRSGRNQGVDLSELEFDWNTDTGVDFEDVGGMNKLKAKLERDIIKPLTTHSEKAEELGIAPTNIIFYGPPGTGKTYLAEALATELDLPFVKLSGADIQSKWINESSQKVHTLFSEARDVADYKDGAVIFLDELDTVLKKRTGSGNAHEEDNKVVNEFLSQLEDISDDNIVFVGATNRIESLDKAGIRPGRIDAKVHIGMPDVESRTAILQAQLRERPHDLTEDQIKAVAKRTDGMTAADLDSLVEAAARNCLHQRGGDQITMVDIHQALVEW